MKEIFQQLETISYLFLFRITNTPAGRFYIEVQLLLNDPPLTKMQVTRSMI